jgi:hypothetical protein
VAVAYDEQFFIGKIEGEKGDTFTVNFMRRYKNDVFGFPPKRDVDNISQYYIFGPVPEVVETSKNSFNVGNMRSIEEHYANYQAKYMSFEV